MASSIQTCLLFAVLVVSYELACVEGRTLKEMSNESPESSKGNITKQDDASQVHNRITSVDGFVEAFRPTTPGHSPGVGHSLHN